MSCLQREEKNHTYFLGLLSGLNEIEYEEEVPCTG
jgi:hypothetical protein